MPIRHFLLVKRGKEFGHWYRVRSVEAIRICRRLEEDLVTRGDRVGDTYILKPNIVRETGYLESEGIREGFGTSAFLISC
jgi:hypothetical protein